LRADAQAQARIDELADKGKEGDLTADEKAEYDSYICASTLIAFFKRRPAPSSNVEAKRSGERVAPRPCWNRAKARCEYCQLRQKNQPYYRFQIEHITPRKHGGLDFLSNLALACPACNGCKNSNLTGIDPKSRKIIVLYNPRRNSWRRHFRWTA